MKTHITTLNNMAGTASLAHRRVLKVAQSIGCHEMGLSFYPLKPDYAKEIDKRLDGIIAPLNYGDIVIFQYPSWIGVNYDESFVNKIKSYRDKMCIRDRPQGQFNGQPQGSAQSQAFDNFTQQVSAAGQQLQNDKNVASIITFYKRCV